MPRAIIDTESSRPAYVRRTALRWAAVAVILVLAAFIGYQIYRFTHTHSLALLLVTIYDVIILSLIYPEAKNLKTKTP